MVRRKNQRVHVTPLKQLEDCEHGDILADRTGSKSMVLGRLHDLIFRSEYYNFDVAYYRPMTVSEAKKEGWKVLTKDGKTPVSKQEVEDLLGVTITN